MLVKSWNIHYFDEVESTNLIVKDVIRNFTNSKRGIREQGLGIRKAPQGEVSTIPYSLVPNPYGYVAVAKVQTCGRGMRGHSWCSPEGGLYFSLLLEPSLAHDKLPEIPLRIATVVMEALQPLSSEPLTIKPPNDIVLVGSTAECPPRTIRTSCSQGSLPDTLPSTKLSAYSGNKSSEGSQCEGLTAANRSATCGPCKVEKLVGISTELYMERLCVGIGINIFHPEQELQIEGLNHPVYLEDFSNQELTLDFVLKTVLDTLNVKLEI